MNILALDLGTNTGAAWGVTNSEPWALDECPDKDDPRKNRQLDPRARRLWNRLTYIHVCKHLDYLVFEDVQFGKSLAQVQLWSSFRGIVWAFAHHNRLKVECLETWKLKQFAAGTAHADKCAMARALVKNNPTVYTLEETVRTVKKFRVKFSVARRISDGTLLTDDEVDAIHLYIWAKNYIQK